MVAIAKLVLHAASPCDGIARLWQFFLPVIGQSQHAIGVGNIRMSLVVVHSEQSCQGFTIGHFSRGMIPASGLHAGQIPQGRQGLRMIIAVDRLFVSPRGFELLCRLAKVGLSPVDNAQIVLDLGQVDMVGIQLAL